MNILRNHLLRAIPHNYTSSYLQDHEIQDKLKDPLFYYREIRPIRLFCSNKVKIIYLIISNWDFLHSRSTIALLSYY